MTQFYSVISAQYDHIFPPMSEQVDFILTHMGNRKNLLEIGSATGNLSTALAMSGKHVTGIDLNADFIALAKEKAASRVLSIDYERLNMTELTNRFAPESFAGVICVGNTLVHLPDEQAIAKLFTDIGTVLKPGGLFALQIINYDRILDRQLHGLPTIDNAHITFERVYRHRSDGRLDFDTSLFIKSTGEHVQNSVPLFPLRERVLKKRLIQAGFDQIQYAGSFKGVPFDKSASQPLIVTCSKTLANVLP